MEISMRIDGADPFTAVKPDARLIKLLVRAHGFNTTLVQSDGVAFAALGLREGVSRSLFHSGCPPQLSRPGHYPKHAGENEFKVSSDSPLEQAGFELVWGFSCQVVVLGFAESSLLGGVSR